MSSQPKVSPQLPAVETENRLAAPVAATIREAVFDDYPQIAAVQTRNGLKPKIREEWEHFWINNPVFKRINNWPIGWVAENEDGKIVGYIGNIPLSCSFQEREIIACGTHAVVMDVQYRAYASFLLRRQLNLKTAELNLSSTANPHSSRMAEAMRCLRVPTGNWSQSVFWITNHRGFLASALESKGWPKLLAYPASAALSLKDRLSNTHSWVNQNGCQVETCSSFDDRFDVFWQELKSAHPDRLLANRSREVLQWHFKYALAQKRVWVVTLSENSRLVAYAVFYKRDNPAFALKRVRLIDFQVLNGNTRLLVPMLAWGLLRCQKEGVHMLEAFGFRPEKQSVIDSLNPYRRQLPSWLYYYKTRDKGLLELLRNPGVWDPTSFDGAANL